MSIFDNPRYASERQKTVRPGTQKVPGRTVFWRLTLRSCRAQKKWQTLPKWTKISIVCQTPPSMRFRGRHTFP